jgi:asparagine synthase (glutamine-hydrolysing)
MCGIAGFIDITPDEDESMHLLQQMCDEILHRGPDDEGYYIDKNVGLGIRRLSIIDLPGGHQPISNEDGTRHIIFNGEIYNFQNLRRQLQKQGHQFTTFSDTEVILHQYEQDGTDCVKKLNGMFAFAIWDEFNKTLLLARDRMGIKPLYYYWDGHQFLFASEIKALLASGCIPRALNQKALWDYLTYRYIPQPETIWSNIYKLLPAHTLIFKPDRSEIKIHRYWNIPYTREEKANKTSTAYLQEFENLFLDAVRLHLQADVPVGILLSGGLDSSAVAAAVSEVHNTSVHSFSVAFQDSPSTDERRYARQVAGYIGTDHHEIEIDEDDFLHFLPHMVYYSDEPLADLASVPLYYVSQLASQKVKVVLSGEGSDEILGGYHFDQSMKRWDWIRRFQYIPKDIRQKIIEPLMNRLGGSWKERIQIVNANPEHQLAIFPRNMTNYLSSTEKQKMFRKPVSFDDSLDIIRSESMNIETRDLLHQFLYIYCQSWLVEDLLMKADKMTMANSIELRVPFLDYRLVEWAARSPASVKVGRAGLGRPYVTKRVLRQFASKRLPKEIILRQKQGFPVPVYDWLNKGLKSWAVDLLTSNDTQLYRWLQKEPVHRQLKHGTQKQSTSLNQHRLWNLLILELWLRRWKPQ